MSVIGELSTVYPEVSGLLQQLLDGVRAILADQFIGMYLFGSLTSGCFDDDSDIDVVVVTDDDLTDEGFAELQAVHDRIASGESRWAIQLEVSYIPRHAIRRYDPADALHPHIDRGRGERLRMMQHAGDWIIQRHNLREQGLMVMGPAPGTLIDPVSADGLREATLAMLHEWVARIPDDPAQISRRGGQSYTVLTICRMLYTLQHGTVVSKPVAARWAREALGERWRPLIDRAWIGRQNPDSKAQAEDVGGTLKFIRYALEWSQQFEIPPHKVEP
jgi:predicted nucleotidyltransferase